VNARSEVLALLKGRLPQYVFRWTDSRGDFNGREFAIDVFGVPLQQQLAFLKDIRDLREKFRGLVGHQCLFVFRNRRMLVES